MDALLKAASAHCCLNRSQSRKCRPALLTVSAPEYLCARRPIGVKTEWDSLGQRYLCDRSGWNICRIKYQTIRLPGVAIGRHGNHVSIILGIVARGAFAWREDGFTSEHTFTVIPLLSLAGLIVIFDQSGKSQGVTAFFKQGMR